MLKELIGIAAVAAAAGIAGYAIAKKEDEEKCDCCCDEDCNYFDDEGREVDSKGNIIDDEDDDNRCDHDYNCTGCPHEDECEEKYNPCKEKEDAKSNTETTDDTVLPY